MAQRTKGRRVLGPYRISGPRWRIIVVEGSGERAARNFETEEEALQVVRSLNRQIRKAEEKAICEAKEEYEVYLRDEKQNKERSYTATMWRLGIFFPDAELTFSALTPSKCAGYYQSLRFRQTQYGRPLAVDSHRNVLAEAKTFLKWSVGKGYLRTNPLDGVEGTGKRRHGKPQLRIDEARKWQARAMQLAEDGQEGAVAALVTLVMGLRAARWSAGSFAIWTTRGGCSGSRIRRRRRESERCRCRISSGRTCSRSRRGRIGRPAVRVPRSELAKEMGGSGSAGRRGYRGSRRTACVACTARWRWRRGSARTRWRRHWGTSR